MKLIEEDLDWIYSRLTELKNKIKVLSDSAKRPLSKKNKTLVVEYKKELNELRLRAERDVKDLERLTD